jgi:hypothetical protein
MLSTLKFITACFDKIGHHQVIKLLDEETAVSCFVVYVVNICPLNAHSKARHVAQHTTGENTTPTNSNTHAHRGDFYIKLEYILHL